MSLPVPYAQKRKWNLGFFHFIFVSRLLRVISDPWIQECIGSTLTSIKTGRKHCSMMLSCGNTKITSFHYSTIILIFNIHVKANVHLNTKQRFIKQPNNLKCPTSILFSAVFNEVHDYLFCPTSLDITFFFFSNFDLCEFEKGGPIWPTVVSPHWCWTDSYCIFSNLQQKCVSVIKNRISFPKWFSRTEKVGRGIFKIFFRYNGLQLAFSSHPSDLCRCCGLPFATWSNRRVSSWL